MGNNYFICSQVNGSFIGTIAHNENSEHEFYDLLSGNYNHYKDVIEVISHGEVKELKPSIEKCNFINDDYDDIEIVSTVNFDDVIDFNEYTKKFYFDRQHEHWWELP